MSMMSLGLFVFELATTPFQSAQHRRAWRHPTNSRVRARPASQFTGPDNDEFTLSGVLVPELTGGVVSLDELTDMANEGEGYPLIDGTGRVFGMYVITGLDTTSTVFFSDGTARRIEFALSLKRIDDDWGILIPGRA